MKRKLLLILAVLLTSSVMAQVSKIPADTRLYLQQLQTSNKKAPGIDGKVRQREAIIGNVSEMCKRNKAALMTLSSEEDIIGRTVELLERYRNGYYG